MTIDRSRLDEALERVHALSARMDLSQREIEKEALGMAGLYGTGGRIPTSAGLVRQQRQQAWEKAKASRGGRIPGPSQMRQRAQAPVRERAGTGKPCGDSHISAAKECRKSGSSAAAPSSLDTWLEGKVAEEEAWKQERQQERQIQGARGPNQLGALLRANYRNKVQVREAGGRLIVSGMKQGDENELKVMEHAGLYAKRKGLRVIREFS